MNAKFETIWLSLRQAASTTWRHTRNHWHKVLLISTALFLLFQTGLLAWNTAHRNQPIAGLRLAHQPVSSLRDQNLLRKINELIKQTESKPLLLVVGSKQEHITPRQLGAQYSTMLIEKRVLGAGRQGSVIRKLLDQNAAFLGLRNVSLSFDTVNRAMAVNYLNNLNLKISQPATEAHFDFQNGKVGIVSEQAGQELNVTQIEALLEKLGQPNNQPDRLDVPVSSTKASITAEDLKPLLPEAQKIINQPISLQAAGKQVEVSPTELAQIVIPVKQADPKQPNQTKVSIGFSDSKLSTAIDRLAAQVSVDPQPKIVSGKTVISQGTSGTHVDGTHAKVEVVSELLKRGQISPVTAAPKPSSTTTPTPPAAPNTTTTPKPANPPPPPPTTAPKPTTPAPAPAPAPEPAPSTTPTVIPIEVGEIAPPVVSQYADINPGGRYPANIGDKKMVYLTFDDGPGNYTEQVLDVLKKYNVHAVFFLVGRNMTVYPNTVKRIKAEGHTIGNHSYTHVDLTKLSDAGIADELSRTQKAIKDIAGVQADLFRPPYGSMNAKVFDGMTKQQLSLMMWSIDPRDWSKPGVPEITKRVVGGLKPGGNVLLHILYQQTAEALPSIIEGIRAHGYTLN